MIAYHYSVTYQEGTQSLQKDYRKNHLLAEPYIRAMENSHDIFSSMLLWGMYRDRWERRENKRKFEYAKDALEGVWEYVRKNEFSDHSVSRLNCVYGCVSLEEARKLAALDWGEDWEDSSTLKILELELNPDRTMVYDQTFYNEAYDRMVDYHGEADLQVIMDLARRYFSGEKSENYLPEVLSDGENRILRVETGL